MTAANVCTAPDCSACDDLLFVPEDGERVPCTCAAACRRCGEVRKRTELDGGYCDACVTTAVRALVELTGVEVGREDGVDQLRREYPHRPFTASIPGGLLS